MDSGISLTNDKVLFLWKGNFGRIAGVFAASFAITFLFLQLRSRLGIDERPVKAGSAETRRHDGEPNAAAGTPAKTQNPSVQNNAAPRETRVDAGARDSLILKATEREAEPNHNALPESQRIKNVDGVADVQERGPSKLSGQEDVPELNLTADAAWQSMSTADEHLVEKYVNQLPSASPISLPQPSRPATFPAASPREARETIAVLTRYSDAWNAKNLDDITALRPGLRRRTVKEELAAVRSVTMRIHPISVPKIEGDRATIECMQQIDQVFRDGIEKRVPGIRVTYVLVRRGANWLIEESR